jgi:hypothetical protein
MSASESATSQAPQPRMAGPFGYYNWKLALSGRAEVKAEEYGLYSDSSFRGEIGGSGSPYAIFNLVAWVAWPPTQATVHMALVLRVSLYFDPEEVLAELQRRLERGERDVSGFYGGNLPDEFAALFSLALGVRLRAGPLTREFTASSGDRGRPVGWDPRSVPSLIRSSLAPRLPNLTNQVSLSSDLVDRYPSLESDDAIALLRAARSYQEAVWNADDDPNFAWLQLVSAVETAAARWYPKSSVGAKATPRELLESVHPEFTAKLIEAGDEACAQVVAREFAGMVKSQAKFLSFLDKFMPGPPQPRPPLWSAVPWSDKVWLGKAMKRVYEHRSKALHESIPFPPAMCASPMKSEDAGLAAWSERPVAAYTQQAGGMWTGEDLPILLSTFEYIVRSALQGWWHSL